MVQITPPSASQGEDFLTSLRAALAAADSSDEGLNALQQAGALTLRSVQEFFNTEITHQHCMSELQTMQLELNEQQLNQTLKQYLSYALADDSIRHWLMRTNYSTDQLKELAVKALPLAAINGYEVMVNKLLQAIPEAERSAVVSSANSIGRTALHHAVVSGNSQVFQAIFAVYPELQRLTAAKIVDSLGEAMLHLAAKTSNYEIFRTILMLYPEEERLSAVKAVGFFNQSVLYKAANPAYTYLFERVIPNTLPEPARLAIAKELIKDAHSLLYWMAPPQNEKIVEVVLELYPETERLAAAKATDSINVTLLAATVANQNLTQLWAILLLLPPAQRWKAVQEAHAFGSNILQHYAYSNMPQAIKLLEALPDKDRPAAVTLFNIFLENVLSRTLLKSDLPSLITILELIPENARSQVIHQKYPSGKTILHRAIELNKLQAVAAILNLLPESERFAAIAVAEEASRQAFAPIADSVGDNLMHKAIKLKKPQVINSLLSSLPASERLSLLTALGKAQASPIKLALISNDAQIIETILAPLCQEERELLLLPFKQDLDELKEVSSVVVNLVIRSAGLPVEERVMRNLKFILNNRSMLNEQDAFSVIRLFLPGGNLLITALEQILTSTELDGLLKDKDARLSALVKLFNQGNLEDCAAWFYELSDEHNIFNIPFDKTWYGTFFNQKHSDSYIQALGEIRQQAYQKLLQKTEAETDKAKGIQLLKWALQEPLFTLQRANFNLRDKTNTVSLIEQKLAELQLEEIATVKASSQFVLR